MNNFYDNEDKYWAERVQPRIDRLQKEIEQLEEHIKKISTCTKCGGDRDKTLGAFNCEECGLSGTQPWGG